jgi:hypothetical protein
VTHAATVSVSIQRRRPTKTLTTVDVTRSGSGHTLTNTSDKEMATSAPVAIAWIRAARGEGEPSTRRVIGMAAPPVEHEIAGGDRHRSETMHFDARCSLGVDPNAITAGYGGRADRRCLPYRLRT